MQSDVMPQCDDRLDTVDNGSLENVVKGAAQLQEISRATAFGRFHLGEMNGRMDRHINVMPPPYDRQLGSGVTEAGKRIVRLGKPNELAVIASGEFVVRLGFGHLQMLAR